MTKLISRFLALCLLLSALGNAHANPTGVKKVFAMDLQGANGEVIVRAVGGWGISCAGVPIDAVYFNKDTVQAYNAMLTIVTAAYMSNKQVRFYGGCSPEKGNNYFSGTYLIISD